MISRLITTTGMSLSYEDTLTPSPTPTPTPTPSNDLTILSCPPMPVTPIPISEPIAAQVRLGNFAPFNTFIVTFNELPYVFRTIDSYPDLVILCNSATYATNSNIVQFWLPDLSCSQFVACSYAGTSPPPPTPTTDTQTSIPGVTVEPQTGGGTPLPELPIIDDFGRPIVDDINNCLGLVGDALNSCLGIVTGNQDAIIDTVDECVRRIPPKIGDKLINVMGQVYGIGVGCGLDVPTIDDILEGPTPTTGGGYPLPEIDSRPPYKPPPTPTESCPVPIVNIAAPACPVMPPPGDIIFSPVITINVPPPPPPGEPPPPIVDVFTPPPVVVVIPTPEIEPTPTPSPTPTEYEPTPAPTPAPTPTPDLLNTPIDILVAPTPPNKPPPDREPPAPEAFPTNINFNQNKFGWENLQACNVPASPGIYDPDYLWKWFGWTLTKQNKWKAPNQADSQFFPYGFGWIGNLIWSMEVATINQLNALTKASYPIANNYQDYLVLMIGGIIERWVGAPVLPYLMNTQYNINYNNPQLIPGIPDLQNLFRKNVISAESFKCLVRANGFYDSYQMAIAESSTLVPSLYDIIRLHRGDRLTDGQLEYYANLNGLKLSTNQGKVDYVQFLKATEAIPGVADLVRMMVRDAADDDIAAKYGTDTDLNNKFAGQVKDWSKQQGVDPEIMKYYWRAHWEIPSNTQLFDMLHKLRPNRRVGAIPANIVTTSADVKQAIQVNDLTPYWVDRVMATSYSSLTRIDAQRAFFIEAITEDQLFDAYMDIGYNAANAQVLVDFTKELKRKRDSNLPGADKPTNIISQLKKYVISETNAYDRLLATGMKPQQAKKAVSNSVRDRKEEARAKCLNEAQRRFFRAEYDLLKYKSVVMQLGIPQENIEALVNETACLYDSRGKEINAGALCKAFKQNIIAFDQFQNRLRLIGYDKDEAFIIAESCQIDKVIAFGKAKLQKEAKERAEAEKAKKAEEKAQKEAEKKAEKAEKARLAEEKKKEKEKKEAGEADETVLPVEK